MYAYIMCLCFVFRLKLINDLASIVAVGRWLPSADNSVSFCDKLTHARRTETKMLDDGWNVCGLWRRWCKAASGLMLIPSPANRCIFCATLTYNRVLLCVGRWVAGSRGWCAMSVQWAIKKKGGSRIQVYRCWIRTKHFIVLSVYVPFYRHHNK